MGLRGTGSKSVQVKDAFVPHPPPAADHRQPDLHHARSCRGDGGPSAVPRAVPDDFGACITTPALGAAQRMLDIFVENTTKVDQPLFRRPLGGRAG